MRHAQIHMTFALHLDIGVWISEGAAVMGDDVGHGIAAQLLPLDLGQFVGSLLACDGVHHEPPLGVVHQPEVLVGLVDADDVHVAGGVGAVCADLAIHLHQPLHQHRLHLCAVQGIPAPHPITSQLPGIADVWIRCSLLHGCILECAQHRRFLAIFKATISLSQASQCKAQPLLGTDEMGTCLS